MLKLRVNCEEITATGSRRIVSDDSFFTKASPKLWTIIKGALEADNTKWITLTKVDGELIE